MVVFKYFNYENMHILWGIKKDENILHVFLQINGGNPFSYLAFKPHNIYIYIYINETII